MGLGSRQPKAQFFLPRDGLPHSFQRGKEEGIPKMKPPYIKLYLKDFAFDIQGMTKKQIGEYMLKFLESYRQESVPDELSDHSLFSELQKSFQNYAETCEKNRKNIEKRYNKKNIDNPLESETSGYHSYENGKPMEYLTKNQEPRTNNQEPEVKKKNTKKKKAESAESAESAAAMCVPEYIPEALLLDFYEHRKSLKKPMTDRAKELLISKIIDLYNDGNDPARLLEEAIMRGWQTVYATNESKGRKNNAENWNSGHGTNGTEYQPFAGHQQDTGYAPKLSEYERKIITVRRNLGLGT